ncbi:Hypothetical protein D9617_40g013090 [Elsinoe fawcettii]|nr:Hypothetical protein D9617_40g013090 [Elsinoe fawcettii]
MKEYKASQRSINLMAVIHDTYDEANDLLAGLPPSSNSKLAPRGDVQPSKASTPRSGRTARPVQALGAPLANDHLSDSERRLPSVLLCEHNDQAVNDGFTVVPPCIALRTSGSFLTFCWYGLLHKWLVEPKHKKPAPRLMMDARDARRAGGVHSTLTPDITRLVEINESGNGISRPFAEDNVARQHTANIFDADAFRERDKGCKKDERSMD